MFHPKDDRLHQEIAHELGQISWEESAETGFDVNDVSFPHLRIMLSSILGAISQFALSRLDVNQRRPRLKNFVDQIPLLINRKVNLDLGEFPGFETFKYFNEILNNGL